jgi:hypothetical protein
MKHIFAVLILLTASLYARDDIIDSKRFEIRKPQSLKGILFDLAEARIAGLRLQLRSGNKTVKEITTGEVGEYDFGEIAPGKYRIRMINTHWCPIEVVCSNDICSIKPHVKICAPATD